MTDSRRITIDDRKKMSFSEAEGLVPLPVQLQWGEIDRKLRLSIWDELYIIMQAETFTEAYGPWFTDSFKGAMSVILREAEEIPLDEAELIARRPEECTARLKSVILDAPANEVLDLVQIFLRTWNRQEAFERLQAVFGDTRSPYQLVDYPPTIIPLGLPEAGETVSKDLGSITRTGLRGARAHLLAAAEALNSGDPRGTIREAIHAVESAAKIITEQGKATLPDALKRLEKERGLHPALREAFAKLYGYTSDEKGIRHALLESDNNDVGVDEALFMFSACTAFVSFLARKFPENDVTN